MVHLGDQLESSNNRRARDFEAETLMRYLAEFHAGPKPVSHIFNDPGQVSTFVVRCMCAHIHMYVCTRACIHPCVCVLCEL